MERVSCEKKDQTHTLVRTIIHDSPTPATLTVSLQSITINKVDAFVANVHMRVQAKRWGMVGLHTSQIKSGEIIHMNSALRRQAINLSKPKFECKWVVNNVPRHN